MVILQVYCKVTNIHIHDRDDEHPSPICQTYASDIDLHLLRQGQDPVAELSKVLLVQPLVLRADAADGLGAIYGDLFKDHPQRPIQLLFFFFPPQYRAAVHKSWWLTSKV